ncbi:MAG: lysophospholipid acyltransferase family protein [Chitinophagales bacterium]
MIILRYLYTFWAGFWFALLALIGHPIYFLLSLFLGKKAIRYQLGYNWLWVTIWGFLAGIRYKTVNADVIDPKKAYILAPNHTGLIDAVMACKSVNTYFSPLAKVELKKNPLVGYLFAKTCVFVDRGDKDSRKNSVKQVTERAKQNISVLIFPEGTRNKSTEKPLLPFHSGAFRIAIDAQLPVVPFVFTGTREMLPNDKLPMRPTTITAIFAEPIDTKGMTQEDATELKEKVYHIMEKLLIDNDPNFAHLKQ